MDEELVKAGETQGNAGEIRNSKGQFLPGVSGNPAGKPPGTFSPLTWIKNYFEKNPDRAEEWILEYLQDKKNRQHLFNQIEGMPKQKIGLESDGPITVIIKSLKDGDSPAPQV